MRSQLIGTGPVQKETYASRRLGLFPLNFPEERLETSFQRLVFYTLIELAHKMTSRTQRIKAEAQCSIA